jgi:magnesium transporter
MITLYCRQQGKVVTSEPPSGSAGLPSGLIWIDALDPSAEDTAWLKAVVGVEVPTPEEMREIEPSSRLYREGLALFMTASLINRTETHEPETRATTFVVVDNLLLTIRYASPMPFNTFATRIRANPALLESAEVALVELMDAIVDRLADTLETVDANVNALSQSIFAPQKGTDAARIDYTSALQTIGLNAIRCTKVDESLVSLSRLLSFFDSDVRQAGQKHVRARIKDVQRDILSLMGYVERLSDRLTLMLDATLGLVNIQQNAIIKIFSVIAVVFLPPTVVASMYGMNFDFMPELHWEFGYPFAVGLMILSAVLPYLYFRHRKWL